MGLVASIAYVAIYIFFLALIARIAIEMIRGYSRNFRPRGAVLVVCEVVFTVTDPPVNALRRLIPPLRVGTVALDVATLIIFFACSLCFMLLGPYVL